MNQTEKQTKIGEIVEFVKTHKNCVPNDVYRHFNGYNWDPEYDLDIDAEALGRLVQELMSNGILSVDNKYRLSIPQEKAV